MSSRFAAVLFDLDGTLIDTAPDFAAVLNRMREQRELPALPYALIREQVSQGARAVVSLGFSGLSLESTEFESLRQEFLREYSQNLAVESRLFPGLDTLLLALEAQNIPWGIVTNKPSVYTLPLLEQLGLHQRCQVAICPDMVSRTKPDPEPMYKACDVLQVAAERCVYVGDHVRDIEAGRAAGMATVAVSWGYILPGEDAADWQADHLAHDALTLSALLGL